MNHVLYGLAANPALPSELVDRLIAAADTDLADALAGRPDLSRAQAAALASRFEQAAVRLAYEGRLAADDIDPVAQPRAALALLDERAGLPQWAQVLAADPLVEHREKLAACPDLPVEVARTLATDPEVRVVAELALWTTPDLASQLAQHPHAEVRSAVAANEATPPAVLAALLTGAGLPPARSCLVCDRESTPFVHDPHCPRPDCELPPGAACDGSHQSTVHDIQQMALRNPATPATAAAGFADHPSMLLRHELAARTDLSPQAYARLAEDPIPGVRAQLADNPAIDEALIRTLATDRGHDVQRRLAHHPRLPLDVLVRLTDATRLGSPLLPRIAAASPAEVEELAASPHPTVRMLLARRRDLPAEIRDALARDPDAKVVKSIAPHPGLAEAQLQAMVERHGSRVLAKVATNPDASAALLEQLARHQPPVQKAFREIARHRHTTAPALLTCLTYRQARPIAAGHPALPPPVIIELLTDDNWQVVEAAAANPSLPPASMQRLVP
ncbi:hypothetical protein KV557_25430 [Kitasatospora aureofaciens]|uniref:hypothetical protein n=1 Tax=Kitasatospora aureofaciens TaxID=1894 RepID=UPI001C451FF8|nr:hypothetical protein [Kitasatospora aureofaciens]MBV6700405.1 hypothetical protein [Kitasatospora aureofaciens]